MKSKIISIVVGLLFIVTIVPMMPKVKADGGTTLLWDNGHVDLNNSVILTSYFYPSTGYNCQAADDFILSNASSITNVDWAGLFLNVSNASGEYISTPQSFNIYIYDNDSMTGTPTGSYMDNPETTALAAYRVSVAGTDIGNYYNSSTWPVYSFHATLSPGFSASASHKYWITIQWNCSVEGIYWYWMSAYPTQQMSPMFFGDVVSYPYWFDTSHTELLGYAWDASFSLSGTTGGGTLLWDNGPVDPMNSYFIMAEQDMFIPFNAQAADDFILSSSATITGVNWIGYFTPNNFTEKSFNIYIYNDDGTGNAPTGAGMNLPEETAVAHYQVAVTGVDIGNSLSSYHATLSPGFSANASQKYWISIQYQASPDGTDWNWLATYPDIRMSPAVYGENLSMGTPFWLTLSSDMSFNLTGTNETPPLTGAPTQNMNITLTPGGTAEIIVNPTTWGASSAIGESISTAPNAFALENNGTVQVDVTVNASNTSAWTLGSSPAYNQFQMQYGIGTAPTGPSLIITGTDSNSDAIMHPRVATFNSTCFIEAWVNHTSTFNALVRIGERSGGAVSWITNPTLVEGGMAGESVIGVATLDSTHFVVTWHSQTGYAVARVGHLSGSSIVWDTSTINVFNAWTQLSIAAFDSTYFVIVGATSGGTLARAIIGQFTGSSITFGTNAMTSTGKMPYVTTLDTTHFVVTGIMPAGPYAVMTRVGHRTGTAITMDMTSVAISIPTAASASPPALSKINSTYFLLSYANATNGLVTVGQFTGSTVVWTMGPTSYCNWSGGTGLLSDISYMGNSNFTVVYSDVNYASNNGTRMGEIGPSSISFITNSTPLRTSGSQFSPPSLAAFDSTHLVYFIMSTPSTFLTSFNAGGSGSAVWTDINVSPAAFVSNLTYDASQDFGLKLFMPTSSSTITNQTTTITFVATMD